MSCSVVDIKAYFLEELSGADQARAAAHIPACAQCREELERLGAVQTAMLAVPAEEPPRRISFVSDKVFEPRWWQVIWRSGPAMGFASAALLAAAILAHGYISRPLIISAAPAPIAAAPVLAPAPVIDEEQIQHRIDLAVANSQKRYEDLRQKDLAAVQQVVRYYDQQMARWMVASNDVAARGAQ